MSLWILCLDLVTITLGEAGDSESGLVVVGDEGVGIWEDGWKMVTCGVWGWLGCGGRELMS